MDTLLLALMIFVLRIINNAVSTIRVVFIARQRMLISAILGFIESSIFAITVATVVSDLTNPLIFISYSGGYAVGSYVGMLLERRIVKGFVTVNAVIQQGGRELAAALRDANFGVTETTGEGREGKVIMLRIIVDRRDLNTVLERVREHQPNAFISVEETRAIRQGYFAPHGRR